MKSTKEHTWKEIEDVLIKELKKTKHIMSFGTIGSCDVEKDIDLIIPKKPKSRPVDFYKEIHGLFDKLNNFLKKKYNKKLIRFSHFITEKEVLKIGKYQKGDLALHTMLYLSWFDIKTNWTLTNNFDVRKFFVKNYKIFFGNLKDLFKKEFQQKGESDLVFKKIVNMDRINSNYPLDFLIECMDFLYNYISKHYGTNRKFKSKNRMEVRENFYKVCDELEK